MEGNKVNLGCSGHLAVRRGERVIPQVVGVGTRFAVVLGSPGLQV